MQQQQQQASSSVEFGDAKLPLKLIKSEAIPPRPSGLESCIDWLPDFSGYSWLAYASSSLLVISQLPITDGPAPGPIFRQVFELGDDAVVSAVSWSPVTPSSGLLAASLDSSIRLFDFTGSFSWRQTTSLIQSTKVDAIEWTASGDGIISVGIQVVLWRRNDNPSSWEIAWKYTPNLPHYLVSATWSFKGYFATAPRCSNLAQPSSLSMNTATKLVIVYHSDPTSQFVKAELPHPLPVLMIQWRPSSIKQEARHQQRLILLTCCMDGTVRLWSEIDDAKVRKAGKDSNDQRTRRLLFCVCSVIEINQPMNGILGSDIHVRWATELNCIFNPSKEAASQCFPPDYYQPDGVGKCEWVIGFGPRRVVTLWAIHCLDDVTPMRYPRVTLWKSCELEGPDVETSSLLLRKVVISRNQAFGPPTLCNLVQLLSCNSLAWFQINFQTLTSSEEPFIRSQTKNILSSCGYGKLNLDGHSGKILQVAMHSHRYELKFGASLDTNGLLLLWSITNISNSIMGLPTLNPTWKLSGKVALHECSPRYTTLGWLPAAIDEHLILLAGHSKGIDCFIVELSKKEEENLFNHKLCTIPFTSCSRTEGPSSVYAVPLPSTCDENFDSGTTILLAVWKHTFKALSWKLSIHHCDFSGIHGCTLETGNISENNAQTFKGNISGKKYCINVDPWSSILPEPHNHSQVTTYDVVSPTTVSLSGEQKEYSANELHGSYAAYHLATGYSDGKLRLWRSKPLKIDSQWELVSVLDTHQCPIMAVSVTDCGRKIATISPASLSNSSTTIHIWEAVYLSFAGSFILEDSVVLDRKVVALSWLTLDNGQILLGVCLQNQFMVYGQRLCGGHNLLKSERSSNRKIWFCVASSHTHPEIQDFVWGPNASAVVVHNEYFSLFSPWLLMVNNKLHANYLSEGGKNNSQDCIAADKYLLTSVFTDSGTRDLKESSAEEKQNHYRLRSSYMINIPNDILSSIYAESYDSDLKIGFVNILNVAEKLGGSLPLYHPETLLMNICSGNWKRAQVAVQNLVDYYTSRSGSSQTCWLAKSGHVTPLVQLSDYLNGSLSSSSSNKAFQWRGDAMSITPSLPLQYDLSHSASSWEFNVSNASLISPSTRSDLGGFPEPIDRLYDLGFLSIIEKVQMHAIIDLLQEVSNSSSAYGSLDKSGRRFWVAVRFQHLYFVRRFSRMPSEGELVVNTSMIGWAFHSDCQENLFDSLLPNESSWHEMRNIGVGYWYTNSTQLRLKMEKLARHQYLKTKDPKACALLYIALNRLQVLAGLFKISKDEKDKPLVGFLSRNFKEDNNKAAALKNAYVLMGKHQLELAVAFFILGGDTASAINVCAKNLGDEQLAIVISRLLEGYGGPLQCQLISKFLLPSALEKGDYWLASFLEWALGNYSQAIVRVLGSRTSTVGDKPALVSYQDSFLDPSIGEYCLMLATSNSMKNALGERNAAKLGRWAILMTATALSRCGLPLEGLERLSSSHSVSGGSDQGNISEVANFELLNEMLNPSFCDPSSNWILSDVALHIESQAKSDMAMHYLIKLLKEHPSWADTNIEYSALRTHNKADIQQYRVLLENFENKLRDWLACLGQKFSLVSHHLINKMVKFLCNSGLSFIGYSLLPSYTHTDQSKEEINAFTGFFLRPGVLWSLWCLRSMLKLFSGSADDDFIRNFFTTIDLYEYYVYFSSAMLQRNLQALIPIVKPFSVTCKNDHAHYEINWDDLYKVLPEIAELLSHNSLIDDVRDSALSVLPDHDGNEISISRDEEWHILRAMLYRHMSGFLNNQLNSSPTVEDSCANCLPFRLFVSDSTVCGLDNSNLTPQVGVVSVALTNLLKSISLHIFSKCERHLALSLLQKAGNGSSAATLKWFSEFSRNPFKDLQNIGNWNMKNSETELSASELLWKMCADKEFRCGDYELNNSKWLKYVKRKLPKRWIQMYKSTELECETEEICKQEGNLGSPLASNGVESGSPLKGPSPDNTFFLGSGGKDAAITKKVMPFESPKEIYKRNGELLEALCVNTVNQQQAALASNRKGLVFFNREDGIISMDESNYIWSKADWPHDGWAGSDSTPVPTCVSPGVGLGSRKGIGSSGLGWEIQEEFEEFLDPPATVENIRTRALSSHPSRPLCLVGSSNTHTYLWEFGKERAIATYGVLPAANVPPPYALASISAVRFDHCGQRFATAALDGTVCTWQLEVGGRSNIRPTESLLCFNNCASDIAYVTASGSIIATAGYSSDAINVVIWDTLAPPTTSRASIMCHEGGARSLSVFNNDVGSGSISPYIVTGGKAGDVGVHDFRYIATGRTKRNRHSDSNEEFVNGSCTTIMRNKIGDQNSHGMLWYIPKAHTGSITRISAVPNTNFFLTGSKDGDVKLWDAKRAKLVYHWPKLHDRHTFLQGGVVRAAVTDIQVVSNGFLTCGGDSSVKFVQITDSLVE
ncbi:DmX-like protein 2 [Heracleum sosnowskyi]|uniref:DmX-like protein 2 n=1 Tax=Heracleum sosnowskyi TaxID=360622 RepID=A0AAD8MKF0_9APIA|nr:DmX-like protein 2 [Heracleum sosnowskyi]